MGFTGRGEEEVGNKRKGGQKGTPTLGANAPTCLTRLGVLDARNRKNMDGSMLFHSIGRAEGARD